TNLPSINPNVGTNYARCLVPTYGYPSSDQAFTTGLLGDYRRMDIPVGRLSATSDAEVLAYLAKVQATEAQPPAIWQKNVLHFAGGFAPAEISSLSSNLRFLASIAADSLMGADTVLFRKLSSSIIAQASADSVRMYIEDRGVSLMTFLAHAFSANFDITIDEPENYQWNGKHPLVLGLSCYIGNIHGNGPRTATEKWVLTPGAGPIAFLAQGDLGYTGLLMGYARPFYESLARENHGGPVGRHMQHAGLQSQLPSSHSYLLWNAQNFALQGDPTLT
ncbi:MAG: C25 family cysteine peptidase, partial [Flavobacteriales bacterium]